MTVGSPANAATIGQNLAALAQELATWCAKVAEFQQGMVAAGLAGMESPAIGFSGTANPQNPGGVSDAQWALNASNYLSTVAQIATGQATQATTFNFINQLSILYTGQLF